MNTPAAARASALDTARTSHWSVEVDDAAAYVTFDRRPDNQLRFADLRALEAVLAVLGEDAAVAVVVLQSGCPGYFLGHADLDEIEQLRRGERTDDTLARWMSTTAAVESLPQPVVAAVDGQAWGGGCELALACTFRIASPASHFAQMEILRGAMPGAGATQRLPRLIGWSPAAHMLMTGRRVDAGEALSLGLLTAIIDDHDFTAGVRRWVSEIASQPRRGLVGIKQAMREGQRLSPDDAYRNEQRLFHEVLQP
jgi:enoyl-CoA hydratase/carnithine racemase